PIVISYTQLNRVTWTGVHRVGRSYDLCFLLRSCMQFGIRRQTSVVSSSLDCLYSFPLNKSEEEEPQTLYFRSQGSTNMDLKQTASSRDYHDEFDSIVSIMQLSAEYGLSCFYHCLEVEMQFRGFFWKAARIGERLSPWVAAGCFTMGVSIIFF
ncbi:Protein of unknown function DUF1242, partial [Cynara cardunculus var. scolymus]